MDTYKFADACDFNNIYIWLQPKGFNKILNFDKINIINDCDKIKTLTTTLVPCQGIKTYFLPYVYYDGFNKSSIDNLVLSKSYIPEIRILIKKVGMISNETLKANVCKTIINYFIEKSCFESNINLSELYSKILSLGNIEFIKTVHINSNNESSLEYNEYVNGLSFACFTSDLINFKDFEIFTQLKILQKFQYSELLLDEKRLSTIIKVVDENLFTLKNNEI